MNEFGTESVLEGINRAFEQRSLLSSLESDFIATSEKLEQIRKAATSTDLLPNDKSFAPHVLQRPSLYAARLLDEWNF